MYSNGSLVLYFIVVHFVCLLNVGLLASYPLSLYHGIILISYTVHITVKLYRILYRLHYLYTSTHYCIKSSSTVSIPSLLPVFPLCCTLSLPMPYPNTYTLSLCSISPYAQYLLSTGPHYQTCGQ